MYIKSAQTNLNTCTKQRARQPARTVATIDGLTVRTVVVITDRKENHTDSAIYEGLKLKTLWFSFDMS